MDEPGATGVSPEAVEPDQSRPGRRARLAEGRRTFQPSLWLRLTLIGLGIVYLILFVVLNAHTVRVRFVFATARVSLIWVIVLSGLIGLVLGVLLSQLHRRKSSRRATRR